MTDAKPSKSARKREYLALQKLGEALISIREDELLDMGLDEDLLAAVLDAQRIRSHGALRRQKQYIGRIMRQVDPAPVRAALDRFRRR